MCIWWILGIETEGNKKTIIIYEFEEGIQQEEHKEEQTKRNGKKISGEINYLVIIYIILRTKILTQSG